MGQYHIPVSIDRMEFIHPHQLGDGLKLLEFGCSANGTMTALALLLAVSNGRGGGDLSYRNLEGDELERATLLDKHIVGRWGCDRVAIIGDYFEPSDVDRLSKSDLEDLWDERKRWKNITGLVLETMALDGYLRSDLEQASDWSKSMRDDIPVMKLYKDGRISRPARKRVPA